MDCVDAVPRGNFRQKFGRSGVSGRLPAQAGDLSRIDAVYPRIPRINGFYVDAVVSERPNAVRWENFRITF